MRTLTSVFALSLAACAAGPPRAVRSTLVSPPVAPPAAAAVEPLVVDARAPSWGGQLGGLPTLRWLVVADTTYVHAYRAGYAERHHVLVLRRGPDGLEWAAGVTHGAPRFTARGLVVASRSIETDGERARWGSTVDRVVAFQPVPADRLAAIEAALSGTPVPPGPFYAPDRLQSVEVSLDDRRIAIASSWDAAAPGHELVAAGARLRELLEGDGALLVP